MISPTNMVHKYVCWQHLRSLSDQSDQDPLSSQRHFPEYLQQILYISIIVDNIVYHDHSSLVRIYNVLTGIYPKRYNIFDNLISK